MKCHVCGGECKASHLNHFIDLDGCFIIIKNVPCMECTSCGEKILLGETIAKIENIVNQLKNIITDVAVVEYPHNVA